MSGGFSAPRGTESRSRRSLHKNITSQSGLNYRCLPGREDSLGFLSTDRGPEFQRIKPLVTSINGLLHREAHVLERLGEPEHVVFASSLGDGTVNDPWKGMDFLPVPTHPVRNKVLLYSKIWKGFSLYLNEDGIVEHVAAAST